MAACGALPLDEDEKAERDPVEDGTRVTDGTRRMLALARAMHKVCAETQAPDGSGPIQMRVGLHVGPVVLAVVGTRMLRCARGEFRPLNLTPLVNEMRLVHT